MTVTPQFKKECSPTGEYLRQESAFRRSVKAEAGRYHLYVSYACPWAHRAIIVRKLKGLEDAISLSVVDPIRDERGWTFGDTGGEFADPINGFKFLMEAYQATDASFDGRPSVPVLWDKKEGVIVNNESAEVIRMLDCEFHDLGNRTVDLYPVDHHEEIDRINKRVYREINNGVYRCGFATTQRAYDRAFDTLFSALDWVESLLAERRFLVGDVCTEADWRLFTTLVRFDAVYVGHFKCNLRRIADYPHLSRYLAELVAVPGVAETINMDHIKRHYYVTHRAINPTEIVPKGPELSF